MEAQDNFKNVTTLYIELSQSKNVQTLKSLAEISSNFGKLTKDSKREILTSLAENQTTKPDALKILSQSDVMQIRWLVAVHPHTLEEILIQLSTDIEVIVQCEVARNPHTPPWVLEKLAGSLNTWGRGTLCQNPNVPQKVLETLANDPDAVVRQLVVQNINTPLGIVLQMYTCEVRNDTLTKNFAMLVVERKVKLPDTEYSALVALYGQDMARAIWQTVTTKENSVLAIQLESFGFEQNPRRGLAPGLFDFKTKRTR